MFFKRLFSFIFIFFRFRMSIYVFFHLKYFSFFYFRAFLSVFDIFFIFVRLFVFQMKKDVRKRKKTKLNEKKRHIKTLYFDKFN